MKRTLSISAFCFLFSALCFGQFNFSDLAFQPKPVAAAAGGWGSPTNNTDGTIPLTWYVAGDYYTNTYVYLPDRWTNGWHLTNSASSSAWPSYSASGFNGYPMIGFDGTSDYLRSINYTSSQPHEVVMVCLLTNGANARWFDSANSTYRNHFYEEIGASKFSLYSGSSFVDVSLKHVHQFAVISIIFNGASSTMFTNNVQALTVNPGTTAMSGMTLAAHNSLASFGAYSLAEIITYSGTIPGTNTTWRSNVWYYLKTKYAL